MATFEAWDRAGRRFDAVTAGQAWHWVDQVAGAVKAAQVLHPGGRLAVFGHVFDWPPVIAQALEEAYRRVAPNAPITALSNRSALDLYQQMFANAANGIREGAGSLSPNSGASTGSRPTTANNGSTCCRPPAASPGSHRTRRRLHHEPRHVGHHGDPRPLTSTRVVARTSEDGEPPMP